jgi:hypothetical protein
MPTQGRRQEAKRKVRVKQSGARKKQALTRYVKQTRIASGRASARRRAAAAKR